MCHKIKRKEDKIMPIYVILTKLTSEGRKTVMTNPNRIFEVNKETEALGAKILAQYATLGLYDFVNIVEAPNSEVMVRVAAALGSRGTLDVMTMAAITIPAMVKEIEKVETIRTEFPHIRIDDTRGET
jgi:uncharacterized protein with GYD domain